MNGHPLVSIVIPTFKRLELLKLAIESALNQTYANIEVVVSDDEEPAAATWQYLTSLAAEEPRLRPVRNVGPHGQAPNMNNALREARGAWIKPLHDDDRLLKNCVERFMTYCAGRDNIALAGCQMIFVRGDSRTVPRRGKEPPAVLIDQKYVHLGMYLLDETVSGPPTTMFINRRAVESGGVMIDDQFRYFADSRWVMEIVRHGDSLIIYEPLVEYVQDGHASLSSNFRNRPDEMDSELCELRKLMHDLIPPEVSRPPLATAVQMITLIRGLALLKHRKFRPAMARICRVRRPAAYWQILKVLLRGRYPGRFHVTPRQAVLPVS